jgi:calcineurin-like phosphoesterase family protein
MTTWITSDTHLRHRNILEYCPWRKTWASTIEEHDLILKGSWNARVRKADLVIHLGDLALARKEDFPELLGSLNGNLILILGNHDRSAKTYRDLSSIIQKRIRVYSKLRLRLKGGKVLHLRHDPKLFTREEAEEASLLLHGHFHGEDHRGACTQLSPLQQRKLVDVGIDARKDPGPFPLRELVWRHLLSSGC